MRRFARAAGGEFLEVCGGVAGFAGADSPVNAVKGIDGKPGREEWARAIEFFDRRRCDTVVELAPWVEEACRAELTALGFERLAEEYVMAAECRETGEAAELVEDVEEWSKVLSFAFFGGWTELGQRMGKVMHLLPETVCVGVRRDGELVAAGQLSLVAGSGLLAGDGTLEQWRGRGFQQILIRDRMRRAKAAGVGWVHSEVAPGSGSQRNYERCGFARVYSRTHYLRRFSGG